MRRETERLLKQADRDLENAGKNLTIQAYEVAAFLAKQAVEKWTIPVVSSCSAIPRTSSRKSVTSSESSAWRWTKVSRCSSSTMRSPHGHA